MAFVVYELGKSVPWSAPPSPRPRQIKEVQAPAGTRKVPGKRESPYTSTQPPKTPSVRRAAQKIYRRAKYMPSQHQPAILASQIMSSPVITLAEETTLEEAWKLICEHRFRHVPIISRKKKLIAIISDRDLLQAGIGQIPANQPPTSRTVRDVMKTHVLAAHPDTEIREIARVLFEEHIGAMPIVDQQENLVGIITRSDILRALVDHAPLELWV